MEIKNVEIVDESDVIKVPFKDNPVKFVIVKGCIFEVEIDFNGNLLQCIECAVWVNCSCILKVKTASTGIEAMCSYLSFLMKTPIYKDNILKRKVGYISLLVSNYMIYNAECANGLRSY